MFKLASNKEIGAYLKRKHGYKTTADFCRAYLDERDGKNNWDDDTLLSIRKSFSKIFNGKGNITLEQLAITSKVLCVSCEEILSAGKHYAPTKNHVTNYEIAQSKNRKVWDEYMKREDKLFLNCDEYRKTVIDYALEFKNYSFMKYLLEENFIWFVDPRKYGFDMYDYGAGTRIPPKEHSDKYPENYLTHEIRYQDRLRTQTIALAIECGDYDILDSMRAREIPELQLLGNTSIDTDFNKSRNENLIEAVAMTESEKVIQYFSDEFIVQDTYRMDNTYMFPFLDEVIERMLENGNEKYAEIVIRKAIVHNKATYERFTTLIDETCQEEYDKIQEKKKSSIKEAYQLGIDLADLKITIETKEEIRKFILGWFKYNEKNNAVSIYNGHHKWITTNIFKVKSKKGTPEIKALIKELNEWHNKIISLGGEENG